MTPEQDAYYAQKAVEAYDANPPKDPPGEMENVRRIVPPPAGTEGGNEAA